MKTKKSKNADLRSKRMLFLSIGYAVAVGIVLAILNYSISEKQEVISLDGMHIPDFEEVLIPITRAEEPKVIKKAPPAAIQLDIVDDFEDVDTDIEIDIEVTENLAIVTPVILDRSDDVEEDDPLDFADIMPSFKGGEKALILYLSKHIKYPKKARQNSIEGKVYVFFVVNKFGKVTNVKIARSPDESLEDEALRVVASMPDWNPGIKDGRPATVKYAIPINFKLN